MTLILKIPRHVNAFSDDELYDFCMANPDLNIERDKNGQILLMAPSLTGMGGNRRNGNLVAFVRNWNFKKKAGIITVPTT